MDEKPLGGRLDPPFGNRMIKCAGTARATSSIIKSGQKVTEASIQLGHFLQGRQHLLFSDSIITWNFEIVLFAKERFIYSNNINNILF